jgi:hypothetical protein
MKDAIIAATEAWVGGLDRRAQAEGARKALDLLDLGAKDKRMGEARGEVVALIESLSQPEG